MRAHSPRQVEGRGSGSLPGGPCPGCRYVLPKGRFIQFIRSRAPHRLGEEGMQKSDRMTCPHSITWGLCLHPRSGSQMPPDKYKTEIWPSTLTQRDHSLPCVSFSHSLVNLPEAFSRLGGRLEAETWLSLGLVVKNHIPSTALQNLKAGVSAAISATGLGKPVWMVLPTPPPGECLIQLRRVNTCNHTS